MSTTEVVELTGGRPRNTTRTEIVTYSALQVITTRNLDSARPTNDDGDDLMLVHVNATFPCYDPSPLTGDNSKASDL